MNDEIVTSDLSKFGYVQYEDASNVFLCDDDMNTYMLNDEKDNKLDQWHNCPECGNEGFDSDETPFKKYHRYCSVECMSKNEDKE